MTDVTWTHPGLNHILGAIPTQTMSLVDVGCGRGVIGALCRVYMGIKRLTGTDVYEPYLNHCRQFKLYDECLPWNIDKLPLPFKDEEYEVCTCIEVIEHLTKNTGKHLLDEFERVAKRIIITTPSIFFEQRGYDHNIYHLHVSLWTVSDFRRHGYTVYGIGGMKLFGRNVRYLSTALGPITRYIPQLSTQLLCIKDVKDVKALT